MEDFGKPIGDVGIIGQLEPSLLSKAVARSLWVHHLSRLARSVIAYIQPRFFSFRDNWNASRDLRIETATATPILQDLPSGLCSQSLCPWITPTLPEGVQLRRNKGDNLDFYSWVSWGLLWCHRILAPQVYETGVWDQEVSSVVQGWRSLACSSRTDSPVPLLDMDLPLNPLLYHVPRRMPKGVQGLRCSRSGPNMSD